jgi:hypothetical protein
MSCSSAAWPPAVPGIGFVFSPIRHSPRQVGIIDDHLVARRSEVQRRRTVNAVDPGAIALIVAMAVALGSAMAWLMLG